MICYRDKTFCKYYKRCKRGQTCDRALTLKVLRNAQKWWGSLNAPIAIFSKEPNCFIKKKEYYK